MLPKLLISFLVLAIACSMVATTPMSYKKNDHENYELDLVPVSSTVIPLHEIKVESGTHPKMLSGSEIKRLLKKHKMNGENPHVLLTGECLKY